MLCKKVNDVPGFRTQDSGKFNLNTFGNITFEQVLFLCIFKKLALTWVQDFFCFFTELFHIPVVIVIAFPLSLFWHGTKLFSTQLFYIVIVILTFLTAFPTLLFSFLLLQWKDFFIREYFNMQNKKHYKHMSLNMCFSLCVLFQHLTYFNKAYKLDLKHWIQAQHQLFTDYNL